MRLCVYCSANEAIDEKYKQLAYDVGKLMADHKIQLVFGGGKLSMMGALARGVMENNGYAKGFMPGHLNDREGGYSNIDEIHIVDTMHTRKMQMAESSDAFLLLPGGFGSMDEFFEIITWKQIAIHNKAIIILNAFGYWDHLLQLMDHIIDTNFARPEHRDIFNVITKPEDLIAVLEHHKRTQNVQNI